MPSVKTAVSLDEELLRRLDRRAEELKMSRSRLIARAATDLLERLESQEMLARLNEVYGPEEDADERQDRERRRTLLRQQRRRVEDPW